MNRRSIVPMFGQGRSNNIDFDLAVAEDDPVFHLARFNDAPQRRALGLCAVGRQVDHMLGDRGRRVCGPGNFDLHGITLEGFREALNIGREGCREQQRLAARRELGADLFDVRDKAHVEHAVGFVDDEIFHAHQQQLAAIELVEQAARRGDQDVDAALQQAFLFLEAHAADQQRHGQLQVFAILLEALGNLCGEFARRAENETARHAGTGAAFRQAVDHRQHESGRLAGAGLGDAGDVAATENMRDGFGLNRGRDLVARLVQGLEDVRGKPEVGECRFSQFLSFLGWKLLPGAARMAANIPLSAL